MVYSALSDDSSTLSQFTRRKKIIITTTGTNIPTDYQILLNDLVYEPEMEASFADIRFNTKTGIYIDYWMESHTDSTSADIWLELPDAITDGDIDTIWMYYGNTSLSDGSSGYDTFTHFASVLADYNVYGNPAQNGDWIDILGTDQWTTNYLVTKTSATRPILIEWTQKQDGTSIHGVVEWGSARDTGYYNVNNYGSTNLFRYRYGSTIIASEAQDTVEKDIKFLIKPSAGGTIYRDGVQKADTSSGTDAGEPMLIEIYSNGVTLSIKNMRYRKYIANEPTLSYGTAQHQRRVPQFIG